MIGAKSAWLADDEIAVLPPAAHSRGVRRKPTSDEASAGRPTVNVHRVPNAAKGRIPGGVKSKQFPHAGEAVDAFVAEVTKCRTDSTEMSKLAATSSSFRSPRRAAVTTSRLERRRKLLPAVRPVELRPGSRILPSRPDHQRKR